MTNFTRFSGKNVFITGHTGFKGAWLAQWLILLGAKVTGYSLAPAYDSSLFEILGLERQINHIEADILDEEKLKKSISNAQPDYIFHLAAQAIVSTSYEDPILTFETNVIGTAHILDALRSLSAPCVLVCVTSDKAYYNAEWPWGYRETDRLGGKDIYSGSKAAAELVIESFTKSFFADEPHLHRVASARAGNVIGGGDWANNRLIPDIYRSWSLSQPVFIRCPSSTRPWQHVLEPLSGYLSLALNLADKTDYHGHSFNFGPTGNDNYSVIAILDCLFDRYFNRGFIPYTIEDLVPFDEARLLKLNCDKALYCLQWKSSLTLNQSLELVSDWYIAYNTERDSLAQVTISQISNYMKLFK